MRVDSCISSRFERGTQHSCVGFGQWFIVGNAKSWLIMCHIATGRTVSLKHDLASSRKHTFPLAKTSRLYAICQSPILVIQSVTMAAAAREVYAISEIRNLIIAACAFPDRAALAASSVELLQATSRLSWESISLCEVDELQRIPDQVRAVSTRGDSKLKQPSDVTYMWTQSDISLYAVSTSTGGNSGPIPNGLLSIRWTQPSTSS